MLHPGVKGDDDGDDDDDDDGDDDCIPLHNVTLSYGLFHYITQKHHVTSIALYYIKKRYVTLHYIVHCFTFLCNVSVHYVTSL